MANTSKLRIEKKKHHPLQPLGRRERAAETESKCWPLRIKGLSYQDIGRAVGVTAMGAMKACDRVLERLNKEDVENALKWRGLENARLNKLQERFWDMALAGNMQAADRVLRISERRAKLNGLDAPERKVLEGGKDNPITIVLSAVDAAL